MFDDEIKEISAQAKMLSDIYARLAEAIRVMDVKRIAELGENARSLREKLENNTGINF